MTPCMKIAFNFKEICVLVFYKEFVNLVNTHDL